jgi:hypothetical protein
MSDSRSDSNANLDSAPNPKTIYEILSKNSVLEPWLMPVIKLISLRAKTDNKKTEKPGLSDVISRSGNILGIQQNLY